MVEAVATRSRHMTVMAEDDQCIMEADLDVDPCRRLGSDGCRFIFGLSQAPCIFEESRLLIAWARARYLYQVDMDNSGNGNIQK
jgi:hypothetical protein